MSEMLVRSGHPARVQWGPTVAGAFLAVAIAIVLGLFGAAFGFGGQSSGSQGLVVLSGIWEIVTPLVALFVGAYVTASIVGKRNPYFNGIMVWSIASAYGMLLAIGLTRMISPAQHAFQLASSGGAALAGLSAILGLVGSIGGSAVGAALERRSSAGEVESARETRGHGAVLPGHRTPASAGEQPELRH